MRLRAQRVLVNLAAVVDALGHGDVAAARAALDSARLDHEAIAAWEIELVTLPRWVEAAGMVIAAADALVTATADGDAEAVAATTDALASQREGAASADRAFRIAMSEGGAAVTAAPLGRLAELLRRTGEARAAVAAILHSVCR